MPVKYQLTQFTTQNEDYVLDVIESFMLDRKISGVLPGTLYYYRFKFQLLVKYLESQQITKMEQVTPDILRRYIEWVSETHNAGGVGSCYRAAKTLFNWYSRETDSANPMDKVRYKREKMTPLDPIAPENIARLLAVSEPRDRAIVLFLLDTGIRAAELLAIELSDVNLLTGEVRVRHGKGDKPRSVFVGKRTRKALRDYLYNIPAQQQRLFPLTYTGLRTMLIRRCRDAGIPYQSPHSFRRAFALSMLRSGVNIYTIRDLMGHGDIQILSRYLKQTSDDLRIAHGRASPADNL